jgi:phage gp16-like protein
MVGLKEDATMHADKKAFTRRGFPVSQIDIDRAKVAARTAGQSLNVWVQRAIHSALESPPATALADDSSAIVAALAAEVTELRALRQEWQRVMTSMASRLAAPPVLSTVTPVQVDESGLADLRLS